MQYNKDQLRVIERIMEHAQATAPEPIVVVGPGGSGKTTCVMEAVRRVLDMDGTVLLCAPTNKAVEVLVETARDAGLSYRSGLGYSTLHGALGLALLPTAEHRQVKRVAPGCMDSYDLIVIDECSMLGKFITEGILMNEVEQMGHRIVFMGDDKQVFPVREAESPVFSMFEVCALSKVERFGGDTDIARITTDLRSAITAESWFNYAVHEDTPSIQALPEKQFKDEVVQVFADHNVNPLSDARVMAWRNRTVDTYNKRIRIGRYGKDAAPFVPDELVLAGGNIGDKDDAFAHTDQPLRVVSIERDVTYKWNSTLPDDVYLVDKVTVELVGPRPQRRVLNVVNDKGFGAFIQEATRRKRLALEDHKLWPDYFRFVEAFNDLRYPYCTTVHKAQGSTYDRAYVDVNDIASNNKRAERLRLLYVACSRPRQSLILNTRNIRA